MVSSLLYFHDAAHDYESAKHDIEKSMSMKLGLLQVMTMIKSMAWRR